MLRTRGVGRDQHDRTRGAVGKGKQKPHRHKPAHTLSLEGPTGTSQTGMAALMTLFVPCALTPLSVLSHTTLLSHDNSC